ncbi:hypothetical protein Purlil1_7310 [Purpureocillium lilacinum]|uniref:Uncharacterized protein n=1 Tax=Purpureocillium lilacinum TaxID=33203 RepID=A0ABR0BX42_PURLI|nr:hypothetical protein Purlil1_7310 [Purpureocillium lilacinum]
MTGCISTGHGACGGTSEGRKAVAIQRPGLSCLAGCLAEAWEDPPPVLSHIVLHNLLRRGGAGAVARGVTHPPPKWAMTATFSTAAGPTSRIPSEHRVPLAWQP